MLYISFVSPYYGDGSWFLFSFFPILFCVPSNYNSDHGWDKTTNYICSVNKSNNIQYNYNLITISAVKLLGSSQGCLMHCYGVQLMILTPECDSGWMDGTLQHQLESRVSARVPCSRQQFQVDTQLLVLRHYCGLGDTGGIMELQ